MSQPTGFYPPLTVDTTAKRVVSHAGAVLLAAAAAKVGLDRAVLRTEPAVFGRVASDPTVSRLMGSEL